jgi:hypothetical protein
MNDKLIKLQEIENFKICKDMVPEYLINDVLSITSMFKADLPVKERPSSYIDWNNGKKEMPLIENKIGDTYIKRDKKPPRKSTTFELMELIGFSNILEVWIAKNQTTNELVIKEIFYSSYT